MNELREILEAAREADREGKAAVLATIVSTTGSSYRRPGARMLFPDGRPPVGFISGGCLEADLADRAAEVLTSGRTSTVVYDMRSPDDIVWGLGLGCNGEVRVMLERLAPGEHPFYLRFLDGCVRERRPAVVVSIFDVRGAPRTRIGERVTVGGPEPDATSEFENGLRRRIQHDADEVLLRKKSAVRIYESEDGRVDALLEYVAPTISLVVFGAGGDALPLVRFASGLGWRVRVADNRPGYADGALFKEADAVQLLDYRRLDREAPFIDGTTPVVVMTHHFLNDLDLLDFLLRSDAPYVGVLGPRKRTENLLAELASRGFTPEAAARGRLYGPAGVDIGSETPEEIALAILAEIRAVLNDRDAGFLRRRRGPLHDGPSPP